MINTIKDYIYKLKKLCLKHAGKILLVFKKILKTQHYNFAL